MKESVPTVSQQQIAAYLEAAAPGVDIQACLIDEGHNLVPHGVWLWDGTAGEHHPTNEDELAPLMPNQEARGRWIGRLIKVILDYEVVADFSEDIEPLATEFRRAA
jgi:hypothetical protein